MKALTRRIVAATLVGAAVSAGPSGCASIWGFEDGVPLRGTDGGAIDAGACNCVPSPPDGWTGPFELFEGTGATAPPPPSCGAGYPVAVFSGFATPTAAAAACACTCGPPTGSCSAPVATVFHDDTCSKSCDAKVTIGESCTPLDTMQCSGAKNGGGGVGVTFGGSVAVPGVCTPSSTSSRPAATWARSARLCGPATPLLAGTCGAGDVCAPPADVAFATDTHCIFRAVAADCPAGLYTVSHSYSDLAKAIDTRGCTPCTCGVPAGFSCAGASASTYTDSTCSGSPVTESTPSGCIAAAAARFSTLSVPSRGVCAPQGGSPMGAFTPSSPATICCTH